MNAAFDRAGSERSVHAEAFAGGAEQRQEEDRQGVEQQQTVAPLRTIEPGFRDTKDLRFGMGLAAF